MHFNLTRILAALLFILSTMLFSNVVSASAAKDVDDPYLWLEKVDEEKALEWVQKSNLITDKKLTSDALYQEIYDSSLEALNNKDKLPDIKIIGDWVYHLKKNAEHPRGVYLRTSVDDFVNGAPKWQTVVDIDAMSLEDGIKWVFHGLDCLAPSYQKCLMFLSPGGGDADEMREFDANTLTFVEDGFSLPKAKMRVSWMDSDHLFVSTDFGEDSVTDSGYPRVTKVWQRGKPLISARTILTVPTDSVQSYALRLRGKADHLDLMVDSLDFWTRQYYQLSDGVKQPLSLPVSAVIEDFVDGKLLLQLQQDWTIDQQSFAQGSVLLVEPQSLWPNSAKINATLLVESAPQAIVEDVAVNNGTVLVTILKDVKSQVIRYAKVAGEWRSETVDLPKSGQLMVAASHEKSGQFFARYEGFITPPTLYAIDEKLGVKVILQQPSTFDSSEIKVEQTFAESLDGTKVPYFVVMHKDLKLDGTNPTHIFAYGGFRVSLTPSYSGSYEAHNGAYGKAWLERGGVFVLANIRGGAEYGPAWHAAALLEKRHKAFEDFEAIAEDLIERKITSAKHLGIEGRSNGGLLVGATMVRRPELYGAVISGVPLLDMYRYNKLLAGASWMAEYGNPDAADWDFIKTYSPYQNVKKEVRYPPIFFFTSTRDDRVHPGHARKMAAKMRAQGHDVDYFENTEGGHKGSATAEQTAKRIALSFTHLWRNLK